MRIDYAIAAVALAATFGPVAGHAATITQTEAIPTQGTSIDPPKTRSFAQFDPSLGTLLSVSESYSVAITSQVSVENYDISRTTFMATDSANLSFRWDAFGTDVTFDGPVATWTFDLAGYVGPPDPTPDLTSAMAGIGKAETQVFDGSKTLTRPDDLTGFIGTGSFDYALDVIGTVFFTGSESHYSIGTMTASATGTVVFDYVPVPEPASAALLAGAMAAIWGFGRRATATSPD